MLKLYHNDMSTCSQKVRFLLAEKGVEWEGVELDLRRGDQLQPLNSSNSTRKDWCRC